MFCTKCGAQIPGNTEICPQCGSLAPTRENAAPPPSYGYPAPGYIPQPPAPKKPRHIKAVIISVASVIVAAGLVVLALILIYNANAARYNNAVAAMSTDPQKAKDEFTSLGNFVDSTGKAKLCQDMLDYSAAKALMDSGDYSGASSAYEAIGDYKDSVSLAQYCRASSSRDAGNVEDALPVFKSLGSFLDSAAQAADCQNKLDYAAAKALFDSSDFDKAQDAFKALGDYSDSAQMATRCKYEIGDTYFQQGKFYSAFIVFYSLGTYQDSAARAQSCVQTGMKTGETYRNPDFASKKVPLTFKTPNDGSSTYVKIYNGDKLVSSLFISSGKNLKVKLPAGSYSMKVAEGKNWYGEEEMYGDEGYYCQVVFDKNGGITWKLKSHWIYTLTLRTSKGGYLGNDIGRDGF